MTWKTETSLKEDEKGDRQFQLHKATFETKTRVGTAVMSLNKL